MKNLLLYSLILFFIACDESTEADNAYKKAIDEGWSSFQAQKYNDAILKFKEASVSNPNLADAYVGLGWTYFYLDTLNKSEFYLNKYSEFKFRSSDIFAGIAVVKNVKEDYSSSALYVDSALTLDPNWSFKFATGVNKTDLLSIQAQDYILMNPPDYQKALVTVKKVDPNFVSGFTSAAGKDSITTRIEAMNPGITKN